MQNLDVSTVVFALVAIFVVFKLRSVLGMRNDAERPPADSTAPLRGTKGGSGAISGLASAPANQNSAASPPTIPDRWKGVADIGSAVWSGLDSIASADPMFSAQSFLAGAKTAYELVVLAFAAGDVETLRRLLAAEAFDNFNKAITARKAAGQTMTTTMIAIDSADIVDARFADPIAQMSIRFAAKLASVTRDASGAVCDGSPDTVVQHLDIWTFVRDTRSRDPNWALASTEAVH